MPSSIFAVENHEINQKVLPAQREKLAKRIDEINATLQAMKEVRP